MLTMGTLTPPSWPITCDDVNHQHRSLDESHYCTWLSQVKGNSPVHDVFLEGRMARCTCGVERPSSERDRLAFFDYQGKGSLDSMRACGTCRYFFHAHVAVKTRTQGRIDDHEFVPRGGLDHDRFYCGHGGWD